MEVPVVDFHHVTLKFDTFYAVSDIHFSIPEKKDSGNFIALVGPSGCGKSTLLNMIAGFLKPTEGQVRVFGKEVEGPGSDRGMIFQKYSSFPHLTVLDNVLFGLTLRQNKTEEMKALGMEMIRKVGLLGHENKYPHQLSGGQQQRVAIARTLILKPRVILMDEPFSALDEPTRIEMQRLTVELWHETRATIFAITHSISEAVYLSDRVWIMTPSPGRIAYEITDCIPPTVGADPLEVQDSPDFKKAVEVVGHYFRQVLKGKTT